jgi:hypothetical protein
MKINETENGYLPLHNEPDFTNAEKACVTDGYDIMITTFNGKYAAGILDERNAPMSYCLLDPEVGGLNRLYEIYTKPEHRGKNLAGILLLALKGELGIKFLVNGNDILSQNGRTLLFNMCNMGKLKPRLEDGTTITIQQLKEILTDTKDNNYALVFEGNMLRRELQESRQGVINSWWYLRDPDTNMAPDGLDMDEVKEV